MRRKFSVGQEPTLQTTPDAPKIFGSAGALPSRKPFATGYLLFAVRRLSRLAHLPISRFADKFCEALRRKLTFANSYGSPKGCNPKVLNRS
jgi:hypothetical protein